MAATIQDSACNIYALVNGEKVEIENLHYTVTRETQPIFTMGSPMPKYMARGSRQLTGTFEVNPENFKKLKLGVFDVYINVKKENKTIHIKGLERISHMMVPDSLSHSIMFIARDLDMKVLEKLEEMTNRELAKRLLDKEY